MADIGATYDGEMAEIIKLRTELAEAEAEGTRLRQLHHEIYEIYAGSELGVPVYAQEAYAIQVVKQMADLAAEGK